MGRPAALAGLIALAAAAACGGRHEPDTSLHDAPGTTSAEHVAAFWNSATVYFLLTDRFHNGNPANDRALGRRHDGAVLRSFEGGDLAGLLQRLEQGYFDSLGVTAIWLTPFVEQIHGSVDEGTGRTYPFHGYWTRDWTAVDPALGTAEDLRAVVEAAHVRGIRVLMDAVINHTGPPTARDPAWPDEWVRTGPNCTYRSYATTVDCTLVATLPDLRTESDSAVPLPQALLEKWEREGRREREVAELEAFFRRTGYPRAPRYYVIKWLTDWVRELGIDGYRVDTAKHFGESVSGELKREAEAALADWRRRHPKRLPEDLPFFMVGEVYGWELGHGRTYDFGDRKVDFFDHGYEALINFGFKRDATAGLDSLFTAYAVALHAGSLADVAVLNYVSSHDDGSPFDPERKDPFGAGTRLLLAPGGAQIYYGDELARPLRIPGAEGDANLRSMIDWEVLREGEAASDVLRHWRRLGMFRRAHPAVGAGEHRVLQRSPYIFSRMLETAGAVDRVLVALDLEEGEKRVPVFGVFADGAEVVDGYSGERAVVRGGGVTIDSEFGLVLLAEGP
jgi:alpha-amylase